MTLLCIFVIVLIAFKGGDVMKKDGVIRFEAGRLYGNMNTNSKFYPDYYTEEEIKNEFFLNRCNIAMEYGFDPRKMFFALQEDKKGTYPFKHGITEGFGVNMQQINDPAKKWLT